MTVSAPAGLSEPSQASEKNITRLIVATSVGNALEWYDITIYGYFAVYVSRAFFPNDDQTTSLLLTFGTFGLLISPGRSAASCSAPMPTATAGKRRCWSRSF